MDRGVAKSRIWLKWLSTHAPHSPALKHAVSYFISFHLNQTANQSLELEAIFYTSSVFVFHSWVDCKLLIIAYWWIGNIIARKVMTNLDSIFKSRDIIFANKGLSSQGYGFSSGHVWMWKLDCEESWVPKNWCFWTVVLEKTLESPLDCKEIQPVHSEGDQPWDFFGRNDAKAETPVLWPPDAKSWLIGKDSDAGRDLGAGGEGDDRGWDGWMASLTVWTWAWVNSGSWWWTGRLGVLWFMGSQRVRHDWATELNWTELNIILICDPHLSKTYFHYSVLMLKISLLFPVHLVWFNHRITSVLLRLKLRGSVSDGIIRNRYALFAVALH